jgi:hypothetical protein
MTKVFEHIQTENRDLQEQLMIDSAEKDELKELLEKHKQVVSEQFGKIQGLQSVIENQMRNMVQPEQSENQYDV